MLIHNTLHNRLLCIQTRGLYLFQYNGYLNVESIPQTIYKKVAVVSSKFEMKSKIKIGNLSRQFRASFYSFSDISSDFDGSRPNFNTVTQ